MKNCTFKENVQTHTHMHIYTKCASGADISIGSSGLGGVWSATFLFLSEGCRLLWSGSWLWFPDTAPNTVSQPLLSSMVERGRTAEQISLCFYALVKAATANTHQRSSTWRQLTPFSLLQAEQLALCVRVFSWLAGCDQKWWMHIDYLVFYKPEIRGCSDNMHCGKTKVSQ